MGALPPSKVVAFFAWAAEVRTMGMHDFCCPGGVVYVGVGDPRVKKCETLLAPAPFVLLLGVR